MSPPDLKLIGTVYFVGCNDSGRWRIGVSFKVGETKEVCVKMPISVENAREWGSLLGKPVHWRLSPVKEKADD